MDEWETNNKKNSPVCCVIDYFFWSGSSQNTGRICNCWNKMNLIIIIILRFKTKERERERDVTFFS